ncbi:MAG: hypothetical protein ABIG93_04695 [archaeon]|nr:hypothetical protein [Nanoarchaeota archaeon]
MISEHDMLMRLMTLRRMVKVNSYPDCKALVLRITYDIGRFSNKDLKKEIKGTILDMDALIKEKKESQEQIMQKLDQHAELLINIFSKHGIE